MVAAKLQLCAQFLWEHVDGTLLDFQLANLPLLESTPAASVPVNQR